MLDALDMVHWIEDAFAGWRYLLSASFRRRTHKRWKSEGRGTALIEILFGAIGVLASLFLVWLLIDFARG